MNKFNLLPFIIGYTVINIISIYLLFRWLSRRTADSRLLALFFSISLSLGITFLLALFGISIFLHQVH